MPIRSGGQAPYAPPQAVVGIIHTFRNRPVQPPFTADVLMRAGVKDSLVPRVTQALKLLDLIGDDAMPTPAFEGLRRAATNEYKQRLEAIVRAAYEEVFTYFDPSTDGEEKARDLFRHYEPIGQLTRIVRLFLALCEEAGIIPEGKRKPAPPSSARPASRAPLRRASGDSLSQKRGPSVGSQARVRTDSGIIPPAIMGALAGLPSNGWTKTERDHFIAGLTALIDFSIPLRENVPEGAGDADDDTE